MIKIQFTTLLGSVSRPKKTGIFVFCEKDKGKRQDVIICLARCREVNKCKNLLEQQDKIKEWHDGLTKKEDKTTDTKDLKEQVLPPMVGTGEKESGK